MDQTLYFNFSQAHAGDNYIVASNPNGGPLGRFEFKEDGKTLDFLVADLSPTVPQKIRQNVPDTVQTPKLTVWRTLNVECDRTRSFTWAVNQSGFAYTSIPTLEGIPTTQYKRACIELAPYKQDEKSNTVDRLNIVQDPLIQDDKDRIIAKREIPQPTDTYWTAHLIMVFWGADKVTGNITNKWHGWAPHMQISNTALIFEYAINDIVSNPDNRSTLIQRTIAHELGHLMGIDHPAPPGLMAAKNSAGIDLSVNDILNPIYQQFTADDLKKLQSLSKPR